MKVGDLVIERRLHFQPFHRQLSMVIEISEQAQRKVMVQSLTTGSIYWLYFDGVKLCK
jgi:predicted N-formylglutamate amidohydrolase